MGIMYSDFKTFSSVLNFTRLHYKSTAYASQEAQQDAAKARVLDGSCDGKSVNL
jgi:hypothetical protein